MALVVLSQTLWLFALLLATYCFRLAAGQSSNSISLHPASIPLVLRSPYLHSWIDTLANSSTTPDEIVAPDLWNAHQQGWLGFIRVDGDTYQWMGVGGVEPATVLGWSITATQTKFRVRAGPVDFNVTFLSPVEPSDWARQSFPFSYLSMDIVSRDGDDHEVQVYTDVTGEWIAPNLTDTTRAFASRTQGSIYYSVERTDTSAMNERNDVPLDGTLILAAPNTNRVTSQSGVSADVRSTFDRTGRLTGEEATSEAPIAPSYPVVAFAMDLGTIRSTPSPTPVVFALGLLRDPVIEYQKEPSQVIQTRRPYFITKWPTIQEAIDAFIADFPSALSRADGFDAELMEEARSAGNEEYADLVALSLRQVMASIDITVPVIDGELDTNDVKSFMKDIGETRRVNPVGTIYASLPSLLYLNASMVGTLLSPLLEAQALSSYPHPFAAPDLGSQYPKATRNDTDTAALGVDSSASMLIIAIVHASKSGEGALLRRHYSLFKKWADFLVERTPRPAQSATSDGLVQENNSNLALKGIIALHAMSKISEAVGENADSKHYADQYNSKYNKWKPLAFLGRRIISSYGQTGTWALAYNLYAAKLLGLEDEELFEAQTAFHRSQFPLEATFGLAYDSTADFRVKSHWTMFTAATMTSTSVRDDLISTIHNRSFMSVTSPFATTWDARSGQALGGTASPAQGAMFALLALDMPDLPISVEAGLGGIKDANNGGDGDNASSKTNIGAIVGGVVGGFGALLLLILALVFWRRRKQRQQKDEHPPAEKTTEDATTGSSMAPPLAPALAVIQPSRSDNTPSSHAHSSSSSWFYRILSRNASQKSRSDPVVVPYASTSAETPTHPSPLQQGLSSKRLQPAVTQSSTTPTIPTAASAAPETESSPTAPTVFTKSSIPLSHQNASSNPSSGLSYTAPSSTEASDPLTSAISVDGSGRTRSTSLSKGPLPLDTLPDAAAPNSGDGDGERAGGQGAEGSEDLRAEVLALRREMEEIRARQGLNGSRTRVSDLVPDEPPPSYST